MRGIFKLVPLLLLCLLAGLALSTCAPVTLLNSITPSGSFNRVKDISFAAHPRLKLDVYRAEKEIPNSPVLLFVHGGGWDEGSKDIYKFLGDGFAKDGYTTVIPNYRLYPEARFPDPVVDVAHAVNWTNTQYPDRPMILIGHSAGAYNVLMAGLVPDYIKETGSNLCESVSGIISLAGPTGIVPLDKEEPYLTVFPDLFTKKDAPLNNVDSPAPPFYLLHGQDDKTVYPQNSERLLELILARGGDAKLKIYESMDHIEIVQFLSRFFDGKDTIKDDILNFVKLNSNPKTNYCQ